MHACIFSPLLTADVAASSSCLDISEMDRALNIPFSHYVAFSQGVLWQKLNSDVWFVISTTAVQLIQGTGETKCAHLKNTFYLSFDSLVLLYKVLLVKSTSHSLPSNFFHTPPPLHPFNFMYSFLTPEPICCHQNVHESRANHWNMGSRLSGRLYMRNMYVCIYMYVYMHIY